MAPPKPKVDLYAAIRRDARADMSYRALMRELGVGFRTVKAAVESVWPPPRKKPRPRWTRLDPYKPGSPWRPPAAGWCTRPSRSPTGAGTEAEVGFGA